MSCRATALSANALRCAVALLATLVGTLAFAKPVVLGSVPIGRNRNLAMGLPAPRDPYAQELLLSREAYALSWNGERRGPNWAAWELRVEDLEGENRRRGFAVDPDLKAYLSNSSVRPVAPDEYKYSCFDRGHMVPSADRTTSSPESPSTYYMSNILPQTAWLNRIEWRNLENYERKLVRKEGKRLAVFSGGIFSQHNRAIGPDENIAVPTFHFKILVILSPEESLAQVSRHSQMLVLKFPNLNSDGSDPFRNHDQACADASADYDRPPETWPSSTSWLDYATTLEEIEDLTGYEFFGSRSQAREFAPFDFTSP